MSKNKSNYCPKCGVLFALHENGCPVEAGELPQAIPEPDPKLEKWIDSVAPYVAKWIQSGETPEKAIELGMEEYRQIVEEMALQRTDRSKIAAVALTQRVYHVIHASELPEIRKALIERRII